METNRRSLSEIILMNSGFLGIEFGWTFLVVNISSIFELLGAQPAKIPILWLALPITGLIIPPLVGFFSDRTWCIMGRRNPYILIGGLIATFSFYLMSDINSLLFAVSLLWILSASINTVMGSLRTLVADILPKEQLSLGYAVQGIVMSLAAIIASCLPWLLDNCFGVSKLPISPSRIPNIVSYSFKAGAIVFLITTLTVVLSTKEHFTKGLNSDFFDKKKNTKKPLTHIPKILVQLSSMQFFAWTGIFSLFMLFSPVVAHNFYKATAGTVSYTEGIEWAGFCISLNAVIALITSFFIPRLCNRYSSKKVLFTSIVIGSVGITTLSITPNANLIVINMIMFGIMFGVINVVPYSILAVKLPKEKMGYYMGIFNFFISLPLLLMSLFLGPIIEHLFHNQYMYGIVFGGICSFIAALFILTIKE